MSRERNMEMYPTKGIVIKDHSNKFIQNVNMKMYNLISQLTHIADM